MNDMDKIKINQLPAPTWRHLKMNFAEIEAREYSHFVVPSMDVPNVAKAAVVKNAFDGAAGWGEMLSETIRDSCLQLAIGGSIKEPLRLDYGFEAGKNAASRVEIVAAPYSETTVIAFYETDGASKGSAAVQTVVKAGEGAKVHLVQAVKVGSGFQFINDVAIREDDRARVEVTQLYLGGHAVYGGIRSDLAGYKSDFQNQIGYLLGQDETLDINVVSSHSGRKSNCDIIVKGVLSDNAQKVFRGTIDFLNGASGATGAENEDVLLMSEKVVNKTIPLILCAEEDVEGSHGASIGRIDENSVFYMMARGMSLEQIYQLMANAKILSVMNYIDDQAAKDRILQMLGGEDYGD